MLLGLVAWGLLLADQSSKPEVTPPPIRIVLSARTPDIVREREYDALRAIVTEVEVDPEFGTTTRSRLFEPTIWIAPLDSRTRECRLTRAVAGLDEQVDLRERWAILRACGIGR